MTTKPETRLVVYTVKDKEGGGSWWTKIGTAKKNKDDSLNVYLDALPLDGKLVIRKEEKREREPGSDG